MIPGSANPLLLKSAAAAGAYQVSRSLRFNSSDSAFCSRTPAVAGNRKTWTWAGWVKRSAFGTTQLIFGSSTLWFELHFNTSNQLQIYWESGGTGSNFLYSNAIYRDVSAWMHIVWVVDTTNATTANRIRVYVNGSEITWSSASYPSLNYDTGVNSTNAHGIGSRVVESNLYLNAYLADIHFIDGQALTPSSFTEVSATTGQLIPKAYAGTYGTNGFQLKFADNSSNTATTLGKDTSGNGNNWTPNNLSVTAGAGNDSLVDSPTSYGTDTGVGGEVRGNYATWNPLEKAPLSSLTDGNLLLGGTEIGNTGSTIAVNSGKWYWELDVVSVGGQRRIGVIKADKVKTDSGDPNTLATGPNGYAYCSPFGGFKANANANTATGYTQWDAGNIVSVALDMDNGKVYFAKNGTWQESGNPATGANPAFTGLSGFFTAAFFADNSSTVVAINFGQRPFAYTAPSGFKALCTQNLPEGTITTSGTYTGNGVADGPFVYLNGVPTAMTVGGNAVTFGTHADKLSNGFKLRTTSTTYNQNALSYSYSITATGAKFKYARAQPNP